jgi:hypothetical protein
MWNFKKDIYRTENANGVLIDLCYDADNYAEACNCGDIVFDPFDTMVVRFGYTKPANGSDLDIMVYYDQTGTAQDLDAVGYNQNPNQFKTPTDATPNDLAYLWWATDDVSTPAGPCIEAVVIGVKNFTNNLTPTGTTLNIPLRVGWFGAMGDGDINIELVTYSGGVMSLSGTNIINTGGVVVDVQSTTANVTSFPGQVSLAHSNLVGTVQYNTITKTAVLIV